MFKEGQRGLCCWTKRGRDEATQQWQPDYRGSSCKSWLRPTLFLNENKSSEVTVISHVVSHELELE